MNDPSRYDVAIIGAGLSGLAAAIRLAHFGKRVIVLERHSVWGGLNTFYKRGGILFDSGLHAVTNYSTGRRGAERGPLDKLCRQIRVRLEDFGLDPQGFSRSSVGGAHLDFDNGLARITEEVRAKFPSQVDGFVRMSKELVAYPDAIADRPWVSTRARITEYLSDPLLVELLLVPLLYYGSADEDDLDWDFFIVLFNSIYREGFGRPRRGIRQVLDLLLARLEESGGELRRRAGVKRIVVEGAEVKALVLDDDTVIEADVIISSAGLVETTRLRSDRAPDALEDSIGKLAFTEWQYVLRQRPAFEPTVWFFTHESRLRWRSPVDRPVDLSSGVVCAPHNYRHAEPLEPVLRVTHLANDAYWAKLGAGDPEVYAAEKQRWMDQSLAWLNGVCGPLDVRFAEGFTPRTVTRYTGKLGGAIYGSPHKVKTGRTDLSNLYLCGTDQGLLGIVGAMVSGTSVANSAVLGGA